MKVTTFYVTLVVCATVVLCQPSSVKDDKVEEAKITGRSADGAGHHGGGGGHHGGGAAHHGAGGGAHHAPAPVHHPAPSHKHAGGGGGGGGYGAPAAPAQSYGSPQQQQDTGYYYYYYPVVEEDKGGFFKEMKDMMDKFFKAMMYPVMYPMMMMYDYFSGKDKGSDSSGYGGGYSDYGGSGSSGHGGSSYASYRSFTEIASDYIPWDDLDTGRQLLVSAVARDECMSRALCHSAYLAQGTESFLEVVEIMIPKHFRKSFKIFKDSAMKKPNCKSSYRCKYLDGVIDSYNELRDDTPAVKYQKSGDKQL